MIWSPLLQLTVLGAILEEQVHARKGTTRLGCMLADFGGSFDLSTGFAVETVQLVDDQEGALAGHASFFEFVEAGKKGVGRGDGTAAVEFIVGVVELAGIDLSLEFAHVGIVVSGITDVDPWLHGEGRHCFELVGGLLSFQAHLGNLVNGFRGLDVEE